jgi:hypothetical protein
MNDQKGYYNLAVHPGNINVWYESEVPRKSKLAGLFDSEELKAGRAMIPENLRDNYHHGKISDVARKKITRAVDYMVYLSPKKKFSFSYESKAGEFILNFITLTLSSQQIHSDNEIKSTILEPFLNTCRKKWKISHYLWRAEKQENGSIHFHIIANRFVPWNELRNVWNLHQQKLGYVTRYRNNQKAWHRDGFKFRPELAAKWNYQAQLKAYKDGILHDWSNPNSTDVHSLRFVGNVRAYIAKYITKSEQANNIIGRLWGSSENLANLKGGRTFAEGNAGDELEKLSSRPDVRFFKSDFFSCMYFDPKILLSGEFPILADCFETYIREHFSEYRPPTLL